jgi:hypothetical protein
MKVDFRLCRKGIERRFTLVEEQFPRFSHSEASIFITDAKERVTFHIGVNTFCRFNFENCDLVNIALMILAIDKFEAVSNWRLRKVGRGLPPFVLDSRRCVGHTLNLAVVDSDNENPAFGIRESNHDVSELTCSSSGAFAVKPLIFWAPN